MLNFHGTLPPEIGKVSFVEEVQSERGNSAASRMGKLTVATLMANGAHPEQASAILDYLIDDTSYPYKPATDENHFFLKSARGALTAAGMRDTEATV
jgi:hypothetical protein